MHGLREGDRVEVSLPRNHFALVPSAGRTLLFAGGIGITPILAMAEQLARAGTDFELHYCTRSRERTAFLDRISNSRFASRVHFHFSDGPAGSRFDPALAIGRPDAGTHLYVCGPAGYMDKIIGTAAQLGWQDTNVHREYFSGSAEGPASGTIHVRAHGGTVPAFTVDLPAQTPLLLVSPTPGATIGARDLKVSWTSDPNADFAIVVVDGVDKEVRCSVPTDG